MVNSFTIGFKPQRLWSSLAALDFFLGGAGAGAFVLSVSLGLGLPALVGLVAVILGAIALLADLGRPERFYRAGSRVLRSWISRGVLFTGLFLLFGVLYLLPDALPGLPWSRATGFGQALGLIAGLGAVGVMMYTGFLLSHSPSIPFWNTTLLPLLFASSALTCGSAVLFVLSPVLAARVVAPRVLEGTGLVLLVVNLVFLGVYVTNMSVGTVAARGSVRMLLQGSLMLPFLGGTVIVGLVLPLVLVGIAYLAGTGPAPALLIIGGLLMLVGGYLFRYCMLKAGLYPPVYDYDPGLPVGG